MKPKTEIMKALRQRRAAEGKTEVRGIYALAEHHKKIKLYAKSLENDMKNLLVVFNSIKDENKAEFAVLRKSKSDLVSTTLGFVIVDAPKGWVTDAVMQSALDAANQKF